MTETRPRSTFSRALGRAVPVLLVGGLAFALAGTNQAAPAKGTRPQIETGSEDTTIVFGPQRFTKFGSPNSWLIFDHEL